MSSFPDSESDSSYAQTQLPALLLALALLVWFAFQILQALQLRHDLEQAIAAQQEQVDTAEQVKHSLAVLAASVKKLGQHGNANAAQVVDNLASRKIDIADLPPGQVSQILLQN
jgi:hypothetical protein